MKKKCIVVCVAVLLVIPTALSAAIFDLSVGPIAQHKIAFDATEGSIDWEALSNIENYAFGGDVRMRILFVEMGAMALYEQLTEGTDVTPAVSGLLTAGLSFDLLNLVRVGLGMGPRVSAKFPEGGDPIFLGPNNVELTADTDFWLALQQAPLTYRATADVKLGNILFGLSYVVDTDGFTIETHDTAKLQPNFEQGRIGASAMFTLF